MEHEYNRELVEKAKFLQITEQDKLNDDILSPKFDSNGNVQRDFHKELELYEKYEIDQVLPTYKVEYFDSHRKLKNHIENSATVLIIPVKLKPIPRKKINRYKVRKRLLRIIVNHQLNNLGLKLAEKKQQLSKAFTHL